MKANLQITGSQVKVYIAGLMAAITKVRSKMVSGMGMESTLLMMPLTKANGFRAKNQAKVKLSSRVEAFFRAILRTI